MDELKAAHTVLEDIGYFDTKASSIAQSKSLAKKGFSGLKKSLFSGEKMSRQSRKDKKELKGLAENLLVDYELRNQANDNLDKSLHNIDVMREYRQSN